MKNIVVTLIVFFTITVHSQEYKLFGHATENVIRLKWMSKNNTNTSGFDLYRKEIGGDWQKLNTTAILPSPVIKESELKSAKNPFPKDDAYAYYIQYKNANEATENKKQYSNYTLALASVYNNAVAQHMGIFYEDASVAKGKKYSYKLVNSATQKEYSITESITLGEQVPMTEKINSQQKKQNVELSWTANENFIGYYVYRNGTKINEEPVLPNAEKNNYQCLYVDANLKPGNYSYTVVGMTFVATESKPSNEIKIAVSDATLPKNATAFTGERVQNEIQFKWNASPESDLKGYNIYGSFDKRKTFKKINETLLGKEQLSYTSKLDNTYSGSVYYYLESVDENKNTNKTMPISVFVPDGKAPQKPTNLEAKVEVGKIVLTWKASTDSDLAGYRIFRGLQDDDDNAMLLLNVSPQVETTFTDLFPPKEGTKYIYKVIAIDKAFNESEKAVVWAQLPDTVPPTAPLLKEAIFINNQVRLQWTSIENDAILSYAVYRKHEGKEEKITKDNFTELTFVDANVAKTGMYEYYLKATDSARLESVSSNKIMVSTGEKKIEPITLVIDQTQAKKVRLKVTGVDTNNLQVFNVYRKSENLGFQKILLRYSNDFIIDETSEEAVIYEYFVEVITLDDQKIQSNKASVNNS
jgi:uncharacterized protein